MKIKTTTKTIFILTTILFFGLGFNFLVKSNPVYADAGWFDYSWNHRNIIDITGSASDLTDYQVKVNVNFTSGKMKSDFSDIRFTSSDGVTLLNHWKESYAPSSTAEFWVKVPSIPTSGTMIYIYYDNPSASSASNGEATFDFFDKFEPSSSKWTGSGYEHSTTGAGYVHAYKTAPGDSVSSDLVSNVIGSGDFKAYLKIKSEGYREYFFCGYRHELKLVSDGGETVLDSSAYSDFAEKSYTISGNNLKLKLYTYAKGCENTVTRRTGWGDGDPDECYSCHGNNCNAPLIGDAPNCPAGYSQINYYCDTLSWHDPCCYGGCGAGHDCSGRDCQEYRVCKNPSLSAEAKLWIDDLYVRKYASPEPVPSFGTEEEPLCAFETEDCSSIPCCSPLSCVDHICRSCLSLNCDADDAEDNSISEMGDAIDDIYCTWNIHDGCLVKEGVATVNGCNGIPSYWEAESCGGDGGTSDLWGEKKVYIDDINDYNIKARCGVDDSAQVWINGSDANIPFVCCAYGGWTDVTNKFITGWNTIKFKAVDACGDDAWGSCGGRWFDLNWEIIPRAPALNGNASSSSEISLSWSDRGSGVTYGLWNSDIEAYIYSGTGTTFTHSGLDANTTYSYKIIATKNGYDSDWSNSISATTWNQLPVADAGSDRFIVIGNSVNLDGSGSYDEAGDPISYRWDYKGSNNESLVSRWYFDENSGDIAYDTSGANNNDGTLKPASPIWTTGKVGNALQFDGIDDYVDCGADPSLDITGAITIEAWVKKNALLIDSVIVKKANAYALIVSSGNKIVTEIYNDSGWNGYWGTVDINNTWTHIIWTYDGIVIKQYINGVNTDTFNHSGLISTTSNHLQIGGYPAQFFNGAIDEVKIYNRALSEDEIENLYEFGIGILVSDPFSATPAFTPDTIGVYHIDLTVTDSYGGFSVDTVSITVANPTICGDNNIQCSNTSGLCEECDGTYDALCPGKFISPGETKECLCPLSMPAWKEVKPKN